MSEQMHGNVEEMAFAEVRLDPSDGSFTVIDSLQITPTFGAFAYTNLDLGYPAVRESTQDLPDADGTYDDTTYHGARAISVELVCLDDAFDERDTATWNPRIGWNSSAYWVQVLGAWMRPNRRFRLYYKMRGQERRWVDVRASAASAPLVLEKPGRREVQLSLVSPSGRIKSYADGDGSTVDGRNYRRVPFAAAGGDSGVPWPWDWSAGLTWGADTVTPADVYYDGTVATGFVARLHAGTAAALQNPSLGVLGPDGVVRSRAFTLTVPQGSWVTIDSETHETYLNHDRGDTLDRYYANPLAGTSQAWPVLSPGYNVSVADPRYGLNTMAFGALSAGAGAFLEVLWFDAYML